MKIIPRVALHIVQNRGKSIVGWVLLAAMLLVTHSAFAQYQKSPPEFGESYSFPSPTHPEPISDFLRLLDVGLLAVALGIAAWFVYKQRNRKGIIFLSIASAAYFGFYRKGCLCAIGAIQNVVLCITDPQYFISLSAIIIFFLPLIATLVLGRIFCSGVCPLGALQDLVVFKPLRVPPKLDRALRSLQYVYLGAAVLFAGWGLHLHFGKWNLDIGKRFLICDWDPFIAIFRRSGSFHMVAIAGGFILAGMFIGRPYCRWLCPYGGIMALLSRVSWKNVHISPDKELDCGMCADACAFGAIRNLRAERGACLACTRCYDCCPRQKRWVALQTGPRKRLVKETPPRRWEAIARTWVGLLALLVTIISAIWLFATYVHAYRVVPGERAYVDSLRLESKTDAEVQKILVPELERQQKAVAARRNVYDIGGNFLLISGFIFIAWLSIIRPKKGQGAGVPQAMLNILERAPEQKRKPVRIQSNDSVNLSP